MGSQNTNFTQFYVIVLLQKKISNKLAPLLARPILILLCSYLNIFCTEHGNKFVLHILTSTFKKTNKKSFQNSLLSQVPEQFLSFLFHHF
jgi:hypothetical protein